MNIVDNWFVDKQIVTGYRQAKEMHTWQLKAFQELNESLPEGTTSEWSQESIEAVLSSDGKWVSLLYKTESSGMAVYIKCYYMRL
jgi:hypothetical protein